MSDGRVADRERAALVGLAAGRRGKTLAEASLDELADLVEAAGARVVFRLIQERARPDPATFLGSGKVTTLAASLRDWVWRMTNAPSIKAVKQSAKVSAAAASAPAALARSR